MTESTYIVEAQAYWIDSVLGTVSMAKLEKRTKSLRTAKSLMRKYLNQLQASHPDCRIISGYRPDYKIQETEFYSTINRD